MISTHISGLILAAASLVGAAPLITRNGTINLNSTNWYPGYVLKPYEAILYGEDRAEVIHIETYNKLIAGGHLYDADSIPPAIDTHWDNSTDIDFEAGSSNITERGLEERACLYRVNTVTDTTQHFQGWDVQMSPVTYAGGPKTTITVTYGYSLTNSITVGVSGDRSFVASALKAAFKVDYSRSWTTSYSAALAQEVTPGYYGTMVSKPTTTRRYGRVLKGCVGAQKVSSNFMADSFETGQQGGISWVAGLITICEKKQFPLTRCNGAGTFK
ncbi:uncharacterized protein PAC_18910 [Phialocephala subalpina]|uniref:Celp0028 effector like protein n=1 Tax=Phialocephala subalpina TaxID=576137 RepID=A0A1L7XVH8_9HELO|nr:uncharacterized protein PAC_18910 [Phialocephala subalpina]